MASQKVTASLQDDKGTWTVRGRIYDLVLCQELAQNKMRKTHRDEVTA